jgi:hypothetical protein
MRPMAIAGPRHSQEWDRRLFRVVSILFPLVVLAGFARTYYLSMLLGGPPVKSLLVHAHGAVMTLWIGLFVTQVFLMRAGFRRRHMALGMYGIGLATAVVIVGFFTAVSAAKYGFAAAPPDVPPLVFLVMPLTDLVMFVGLFAAAISFRRRPADHKRLMLLTVINFLPPALARLPHPAVQAAGPVVFFGVPAVLTILLVTSDRFKTGVWNRVFLIGGLALVLSFPLRIVLGNSRLWLAFSQWVTSWAA